ncbi:hypothetical protein pb186bvf_021035 [Paramecium bursaria]
MIVKITGQIPFEDIFLRNYINLRNNQFIKRKGKFIHPNKIFSLYICEMVAISYSNNQINQTTLLDIIKELVFNTQCTQDYLKIGYLIQFVQIVQKEVILLKKKSQIQ